MNFFSTKDTIDATNKLFNGKDPIIRLNGLLEVIAFILAMIDFFGLRSWIDVDASKVKFSPTLGILSTTCFWMLVVYAVLQVVPVISVHPKLETMENSYETVTWIFVIGKLIYDFVNKPGITISLNANFGVYLITIVWLASKQVVHQYRWNLWRVESLDRSSGFYDINGNEIYDNDIVKYNQRLYRVERMLQTDGKYPIYYLILLNCKKDELDKVIQLWDVINDKDKNYDLIILKKSSWERIER